MTSEELREKRILYGITQRELGLQLGLSFSAISAIERGERNFLPKYSSKAIEVFDKARKELIAKVCEDK